MEDPDPAVQKLIRLKRYETPGEAYFENFFEEFKDRQRSELLRQSSCSLLAERVSMWFDEINGRRWLAPAGSAAAAAIGAGVFLTVSGPNETAPPAEEIAEVEAREPVTPTPVDRTAGPDSFELALPDGAPRVPEFGSDSPAGSPGVLQAGSRGSLREL